MKYILEIPPLEELYTSFDLIRDDQYLDGMSLEGNTFIAEYWEDVLDYAECDWILFRNLLPHDIASRLADVPPPLQKQLLEYAAKQLKRTVSFDLNFISINLGFDQLAWPDCTEDEKTKGLESRKLILDELLKSVEMGKGKLCLPIRLPLPSIASGCGQMLMDFIESVDHLQLGLMLLVVIDELKTQDPEQLDQYIEMADIICFQYTPRLGIKPTESFHKSWAKYLKKNKFNGTIGFIPTEIQGQDIYNYDMNRLSKNIKKLWKK